MSRDGGFSRVDRRAQFDRSAPRLMRSGRLNQRPVTMSRPQTLPPSAPDVQTQPVQSAPLKEAEKKVEAAASQDPVLPQDSAPKPIAPIPRPAPITASSHLIDAVITSKPSGRKVEEVSPLDLGDPQGAASASSGQADRSAPTISTIQSQILPVDIKNEPSKGSARKSAAQKTITTRLSRGLGSVVAAVIVIFFAWLVIDALQTGLDESPQATVNRSE